MSKFNTFLKKISFIAYLCSLKTEVANSSISIANEIISKKEEYKKRGDKLNADLDEHNTSIIGDTYNIEKAPQFSAQTTHQNQIIILRNAINIRERIAENENKSSQLYKEFDSWNKEMSYVFVVKKCHVSSNNIKSLSALLDFGEEHLKSWVKYGHTVENLTYNEAALLYAAFSQHKFQCFYGLKKINDRIDSTHKEYVSGSAIEKKYSKTTLGMRIFLSSLWILFFGIFGIMDIVVWDNSAMLIFGAVGAVVLFFGLWGIQKLLSFIIVPISNFIIPRIMVKIEKTYDIALSNIVAEEIDFFEDQLKKATAAIKSNNRQTYENKNKFEKYLRSFLSKNLPFESLEYVVEQMMTGCSYSDGCWRAEQVLKTEKWQKQMLAIAEKEAEETKKHQEHMRNLKERDTLANENLAREMRARNSALRDVAASQKEAAKSYDRLRKELRGY